jgi:multidrug efflux pump subunit AcrA (membrane-fusion protein)
MDASRDPPYSPSYDQGVAGPSDVSAAPGNFGASRALRWPALVAYAVGTFLITAFLITEVVVPGYVKPTTRTSGTRLGYPALRRRLGLPQRVTTAVAEDRTIVHEILGEGTMGSDPVLVPMIPLGKITAVYVQPGQRVHKGDILAEIDARKGLLAAEQARLAFVGASAELRRVQIGSVLVENREQPGKDAIDVKALRDQVDILRDLTAMEEKLTEQGLVTREKLLESRKTLATTEQALAESNLSLTMSTPGKRQSESIAASVMQQAVLLYKDALEELNDYKIVAPADGIIERVVVHPGEYNQSPGAPAFVLAAGLWFEAYFNQTAIADITNDAQAEVHLEARPDATFLGRISSVNPVVSYGTGGPETTRPIRPVGTGAPEWPATFRARIQLPPEVSAGLVPGLTGFARVTIKREAVAVPQAALLSMSAGNGLLFAVNGSRWEARRATYGATSEGWVEVLSGISKGEKVIVEGQQVLLSGDRIEETAWRPASGTAL